MGWRCSHRVSCIALIRVTLTAAVMVALVTMLVNSPPFYKLSPREPIDSGAALRWDGLPLGRGDPQWQKVDHQGRAFVYAAHYDDIEWPPLIRIIGIADDPLPYFFVTCRYYGRHGGHVIANVTGSLLHLRQRNGRRYMGAYVECPLTHTPPLAVSVDKGNQNNGLNYMHVHYSRLVQWPELPPSSQPPPPPPPPSSETDQENEEDDPEEEQASQAGNQQWRQKSRGDGEDEGFLWNVTRCFPAFQAGYDDHVMLAEVVAISRLLGVDHFVFYVQHAGPRLLQMLQVLESQGDVEVHPWNINMGEKDLYYAGQFSSINDCLYRHLWTSRFLLFGDVDELFVQRDQAALLDLLQEEFALSEECGAFLFLNVFFNLRLSASSVPVVNGTQTKYVDQLKMLTHTRRHAEVLTPSDRSKPAVDPRKVKTGSVHVIETFRQGYESCVMEPERGLLHHYRDFELSPEDQQMDDPFLWDIFEDLLEEISYVLNEYDKMAESV